MRRSDKWIGILIGVVLGGTVFATGIVQNVMTTLGDTIYGGILGQPTRLPGNTSTITKVWTQTGDGVNSAAPSWQTVPTAGTLTYYFTSTASSPTAAYKQMTTAPFTPKTTLTTAAVGTGTTVLQNFATNAGSPGLTFIPAGQYEFHIHASKTAGTKVVTLQAQFWEVSSAEVDIGLIGTSEPSSALTGSEVEYRLFFVDANTVTLASAGSRIVARVQAVGAAAGTAATVNLFVGDEADSHIALPSNTVDASNFVPYSGATGDVNLGTHSLIATSVQAGTGSGVGGVIDLTQGTAPSFPAANTFSLYAPTSIPSSYQWQVPSADGLGCIQSNGFGVLSIGACGGGGGSAGATLFSSTTTATVTAASATTLIGTVTGSTTVPANTWTAGSLMQVFAEGYYSTPAAARTLKIDLNIGGSTRVTTGAVTVPASVTNGTWQFLCGVTTRTTGGSGTQIANCTFAVTGTTLTAPGDFPMQTASAWTIDTTANEAMDLQATWDSTTGAPTISCSNVAAWIPGAPVTSVGGLTGAVPGVVRIGQVVTSGSQTSVVFSAIPGTYTNLIFTCLCRTTSAVTSVGLRVKMNSDGTAANYDSSQYSIIHGATNEAGTVGSLTSGPWLANISGASSDASYPASVRSEIQTYAGTVFYKRINTRGGYADAAGDANRIEASTTTWKSTAAITTLTITLDGTNPFLNGSVVTLYAEP